MARRRLTGKQAYDAFGSTFRAAYHPKQFLEKAAFGQATDAIAAGTAATLGHPEYVNLNAGESRTANAVVSFVDIRGFTKLSFVLEAEDLLRIVQALTTASINVITDGGGYIGEFTGDGVMAYFGDSTMTDEEATAAALETTSLLFKTVEEIVNPELQQDGIDPIRIAAGMEYGKVLWSRVGVGSASQIKPIANATFLAGKLSGSKTSPWECKVGAQLAEWVPDEYKTKTEQFGPFTVKGETISRALYLLDWRTLANDTLQDLAKVETRVRNRINLARAGTVGTARIVSPTGSAGGPRPLKDQPFFGR